jgi:activator of HSP90 ATPase
MPDYKKYFVIPAPPEEVYAALTFEPTIELWTGSPASFKPEPGSEFAMWDESIVGKNVAFEPGKQIDQEWYFGEQPEPSRVTIKLHDDKKGTSIEVRHTNIPEEAYEDIVDGWENIYMRDLREFYLD